MTFFCFHNSNRLTLCRLVMRNRGDHAGMVMNDGTKHTSIFLGARWLTFKDMGNDGQLQLGA